MTTASWVIVDRATGKAICETWSPKVAANVRRADKADVVPIGEWLARVNAKARHQGNETSIEADAQLEGKPLPHPRRGGSQ